ncbi:phosphotransferase family protein [Kribbella sp. NPDC004875]|uniref:phosphotransferase family protein n=1 Tax=Kribbella sp. NPDC004875 TaxID=3364107 RepID=UPI00368A4DCD
MDEVSVVVAHSERATLHVGDVFLKVDADRTRLEREIENMNLAPVSTPRILWHRSPVLAITAAPGTALGRVGEPSIASSAAWAAAGAAVRQLHDAPAPVWAGRAGRDLDELAGDLDDECERLVADGVLPAELVTRNRGIAEAALRPWTPVFTHGDLHIAHVFVDGDELTGILDWSEAGQGDAMYDLASLTVVHQERLEEVLAGYGAGADLDAIRGWWSLRTLMVVRWLIGHGYDPFTPGGAVDVLKAQV